MSRTQILKKLSLYRQNPDIVQPLTNAELADLVVIVLNQVDVIKSSIETGQISATELLTKEINKTLKEYRDKSEVIYRDIKKTADDSGEKLDNQVKTIKSDLQNAIDRLNARVTELKDGRDGIVTEAEISRAASLAAELIELPDFEQMVSTAIQADSQAIRNAI